MDNAISPKMPFNETGECIAYFVREASKNTNLYNIGTLKARFPEILERAASGLIAEVARKLIKWSYSPHGGEADGTLLVYMRDGSLIAYVAHPNHIAWQDRNSWGTDISQSGPIALAYFRNRLSKILKV
ncbi:unnamed protein product [Rotaria sp. Silwood1]|nr:unnamed protein product [Rotaria sp. Silwood1]